MKRLIKWLAKRYLREFYLIPNPANRFNVEFIIERDLPEFHLKRRPVRKEKTAPEVMA